MFDTNYAKNFTEQHIFKAYRTYGRPEGTILVITADTLEEARSLAEKRFNVSRGSDLITVAPVTPTQDPQVYEI